MTSQKVQLDKLNNTRDLSGLRTRDGGQIRPKKLLRSGHLYAASDADKAWLSSAVGLIVDFRTAGESQEKPNPNIAHAGYIHLPILQDLTAGITKEKASTNMVIGRLSRDPGGAKEYMMHMYTNFVSGEFAVAQYARFLELLCEERDGAVLWHCTAGKDRAGFAAALVEEILGVSRDDIMEDYLMTNACQKEEVDGLVAMLERKIGSSAPEVEEALRILFGAREEYLTALYRKVEELYGDFGSFLQNGLGFDGVKQEKLRRMYLE